MDATILDSRPSSTIHLMDNPSTSDTSLDQVSSLRAVALSTLRSKRRKPGTEKVTLSRPPAPESIQLDYGQEEQNPQLSTKPASTTNVVQNTDTTTTTTTNKPAAEDLQMREEGEISEEEEVPPSAPQAPKETRKSPAEELKSPSVKPSPPARPYTTIQQASTHSPVQSRRIPEVASVSPRLIPATHHIHLSAAQITLLSLDANHVRPGLQMTQQQYDTAKDIILDLLGWGVPPEYLVECGLSREIVFYVFVELNLRLPQNLDTTGLIPYTLETVASARQAASLPMQQDVRSLGILSPRSPMAKAGNGAAVPLKLLEVPSIPVATEPSISPTSLHDMEMQRKQELLARKRAVIASRKLKQSSSSMNAATTSQASLAQDEPASAVTADVDDFLKSISTPKELDASASTPSSGPASSHLQSDDVMDVDDIPGLGGLVSPPSALPLTPPSRDQRSRALSPTSSSQSFAESLRPVEKSESVSSMGSSASLRSYGEQSRRGAKRPVASDFVDFDTYARHPTTNGSTHHYPFARRKVTAIDFGSVSNGNRRCVIDLSDSEEETEDMLRLGVERGGTPGSSSTPPLIPSPPATPGGIIEPSQLELEIQRMKELIAVKERERRKKLASRSHNAPESSAMDSILKIKHEEAIPSLHPRSPLSSDSMGANQLDVHGPTVMSDDVTKLNEPCSDSSVVSVAAALAGAGNSASATPAIDDDPYATNSQDRITEGQLIDGESAEDVVMRSVDDESATHAEQEQASELVDVDVDMSSSAQATLGLPKREGSQNQEDKPEDEFTTYESPLGRYPLLRIRSEFSSIDMEPASFGALSNTNLSPDTGTISVSNHSLQTDTHFPDLKLLKLAVASKDLDPLKRICQFEIPGGGVCRDEKCEDAHVSRFTIAGNSDTLEGAEPNDDETAEFLFSSIPTEWLSRRKIKSAADIKLRLQNTGLRLEERVRLALAALEPPPE